MTPILLAGLALELLSLDEMRVYLRLETSEEEGLVPSLIKAVRNAVEQGFGAALTALLGGVNAIVGRMRASTPIA